METLPNEKIYEILDYLDFADHKNMLFVSVNLYQLVNYYLYKTRLFDAEKLDKYDNETLKIITKVKNVASLDFIEKFANLDNLAFHDDFVQPILPSVLP